MTAPVLRLPYHTLSPDAFNGLLVTKNALDQSSLGIKLIELVYLRVSQINGCAYCLNLHSTSLRKHGETQDRIDELAGWRVSHRYTEAERAALAWAEAMTYIGSATQGDISDEIYLPLVEHFDETERADLTLAIGLMNGMNRLAIALRQ